MQTKAQYFYETYFRERTEINSMLIEIVQVVKPFYEEKAILLLIQCTIFYNWKMSATNNIFRNNYCCHKSNGWEDIRRTLKLKLMKCDNICNIQIYDRVTGWEDCHLRPIKESQRSKDWLVCWVPSVSCVPSLQTCWK